MSKTEVKDYKVVLREIVTKTSSGGKIRNYTRDYLLFDAKNHISLGQNAIFEAQVNTPLDAIGYTAIGNIISKAYYLTLIGQVSCCYSNPKLQILTTFISTLD